MAAELMKPQMMLRTGSGSPVGRVTMAGMLRNHPGMPEKPTRMLGSYAVVYLLRGSGAFRAPNYIRRRVTAGDLLMVFPDIPHWYGPEPGEVWDEIYIVFAGAVFDPWRAKGLLDPREPIRHLEPLKYWHRRLQEVAVDEGDSLQQICALQHLLAEVLEMSSVRHKPQWLERAHSLLGKVENHSPEDTARLLGMSYESFRKRFAAATGDSPNHYRLTKIIDRACAMIITGNFSNKEIAERLGFCDEFSFSHRFKEIVGVSPTHFRQKLPVAGKPPKARKP